MIDHQGWAGISEICYVMCFNVNNFAGMLIICDTKWGNNYGCVASNSKLLFIFLYLKDLAGQTVLLTRAVSGISSLQSSLRVSSFSSSSSELGHPGVIAEPGGRGPVSPRCFLVMWASGPCTVFTCLRKELGSVYRLVQPGILHT